MVTSRRGAWWLCFFAIVCVTPLPLFFPAHLRCVCFFARLVGRLRSSNSVTPLKAIVKPGFLAIDRHAPALANELACTRAVIPGYCQWCGCDCASCTASERQHDYIFFMFDPRIVVAHSIAGLDPEMTVQGFLDMLQQQLALPHQHLSIRAGFPPKAITMPSDPSSATLASLQVCT